MNHKILIGAIEYHKKRYDAAHQLVEDAKANCASYSKYWEEMEAYSEAALIALRKMAEEIAVSVEDGLIKYVVYCPNCGEECEIVTSENTKKVNLEIVCDICQTVYNRYI